MDTVGQAKSQTALLKFDIVIVGGGMVGMTLALALAKDSHLSILILEANAHTAEFSASHYHHRVSAVSLASIRIFQALDVWKAMREARVSPFTSIQIWDGFEESNLKFECNEIAEPVLGYIIENNVMLQTLREKIQSTSNITYISPVALKRFSENETHVLIEADDATVYQARLAIAADGANSWLREQAGIQVNAKYYDQLAIVATVETEKSHEQSARQVFLPTGPLAFLPLQSAQSSSIVWSLPRDAALEKVEMPVEKFQVELEQAFGTKLGNITSVSKRFTFPLKNQQAEDYVRSRVALVGDAAHVIHPLAGQGVNLGLLDAASLAEVILDAEKANKDFSAASCLRRYERWRRADNLALLTGVDVIKHVFSSEHPTIKSARTLGLSLANQLRGLKNIFTRHAVGCGNGLPRLAKSKN